MKAIFAAGLLGLFMSCSATASNCVAHRRSEEAKNAIGNYIPQCDESGNYHPLQCSGSSGKCWCADVVTGDKTTDDTSKCMKTCREKRAEELAKNTGFGQYIPQCNADGNYVEAQCASSGCWCVEVVTGDRVSNDLSHCNCAAKRRTEEARGVVGNYIPQCDADGNYNPRQCSGSSGMCWCVETVTGEKTDSDVSNCQ